MAYTIFNTRNNSVAVVEDGTIDNTTDLKLIGKNYAGYGEIQNENFVYLLENFAGANQPPRPIAGQLWFNTTSKKIEVYDGNSESVFVPLGNVHIGSKPSGSAITAANVNKGDLWWDDVTSQLYAHNGAASGDPFVLVGPKGNQTIKTTIDDDEVYDNLFAGQADDTPYKHKILKGFVDDVVIFTVSNDEFTLDDSNPISGFDRIKKGITLLNTENSTSGVTTGNYQLHGTVSNALQLGGTLAAEFVQRSNPTFVTQVDIADNDGLLIGPNDELLVKISGGETILESTITNADMSFKVKDAGGSTVIPLKLSATGPIPNADNTMDIGSTTKRWNEVHAVNFRGIADEANTVLSDGTYKIATKGNTFDALVTRDSVGDIFGTSFRGTHLYNSTDATAALTGRVTKADGVQVDGGATFIGAATTATANTLVARDNSGNITATQFSGLASRAATLQVATGANAYEYRVGHVADGAGQPDTVAVRDSNGKLYATEFIGALNGASATANKWTTARIITVDGDLSGQVTIDGSQDVTLTLTAGSNSVALGTDTTGNYVQNISTYNNDAYLNVYVNNVLDGAGAESAVLQLGLDASTAKSSNTLVARDASNAIAVGPISSDDITATTIDGSIITASTRLVGHVNESGTANDGWFDNLTVGTLNATNFNFNSIVTAIANGGTGATTAPLARTNLDVYSKGEVDTTVSNINNAISGVSTTSVSNGTSSVAVANDGDTTFTHNSTTIGKVKSTGIDLEPGFKFIGTATEADFADLAEKYTTNEELAPGTVVCVSTDEDSELKACGPNDFPVGIISTDPAYLMNANAEGQAIALKGRVPTRVLGAVNKGDILYASYDGVLIKEGAQKVAIALTTSTIEEEKVVECMIIL